MSELTQAVDAVLSALEARDGEGAVRGLYRLAAMYESVLKERDEARHAKGQMELRWQAAEKECAALRADLDARTTLRGIVAQQIRACQATHPGRNWCEKCR